MSTPVIALCALILQGAPLPASSASRPDAAPALLWSPSLDAALGNARRDASFVFIALPVDVVGEGRGQLKSDFWADPKLRKALAKGRSVVGSHCKHVEGDEGLDAEGKPLARFCSRFGQLLCEQHLDVEKQTVARWFGGEEPTARPAFLVLRASDGALLARQVGPIAPSVLAATIVAATAFAESDGDPAVPAEWIGRAQEPDPAARAEALVVLSALRSRSAEEVRASLYERAPDDGRRAEILAAIAGSGNAPVRAEALAALESKSPALRAAAARALGASGEPASAEMLLKLWSKALSEDEKCAVLWGLARCGRASDAAKEVLRKGAADPKPAVRAAALLALSLADPRAEEARKALRQKLESDPDPRVRAVAAVALVRAAGEDENETLAALRARKAKEKDAAALGSLEACVSFLEGSVDRDLPGLVRSFGLAGVP